ncbi:MAG TPA: cytochrome c biogenesis protein CcsA [Longimicrobiales bacterium]|nr:cytochrome c biogenesis protein CcsA [Longimicrobiales bacterium]
MTVTIIFATALVLYVGASGMLAASFAGGRVMAPRSGAALIAAAVLLHGVGLVAFTANHAELPLVGLAPSLCTLAFLIALFLFATTIANESKPVALVLVPLIALLLAIALVLGIAPSGQPLAFRGVWFSLHVLLAFIGYAGLAIAFGAGVLYLLQFRELKGKRLGRVFRFFPPLPVLDTLGRRGIIIGFAALTLALVLGWAWTVRFQRSLATENPQVIWGIITWLTFVALLYMRLSRRAGSERRAAFANVIGFIVVVACYVMLRVFMTGEQVFL